MGWNALTDLKTGLFDGLKDGDFVYFVHSFAADVCGDSIAVSDNGRRFSAAMRKGNFYGAQFHPEKSGDVGEMILRNFMNL
jgi:glutamine amidotransferase